MEALWYKSWPDGVRKHLDYPNITIHAHFEDTVRRNPDYPFLSILGMNYSYSEINDQANRLANALLKRGISKGDKIGIFAPNIPQWVVAFYGVLKTGATVVLISPLLGSEDLKHIILDSEIKLIIALDLLYPKLADDCFDCPVLQDEENIIITSLGDLLSPIKLFLAKAIRKLPKNPPIPKRVLRYQQLLDENEPYFSSVKYDPEYDIAVLAYTGGTTGTPKGAMLTHRNIISNMRQAREWAITTHPLGVHKKFLGAVPFFHAIGLTTVFLATVEFESTVYLVPNPREFESILKLISKERINYFHGVPTLFKAIMNIPNFHKYDMNSLDIIFSGGAPLPAELAIKIEKAFKNALVVEAYGMTELSPMVAANPLEKDNRKYGSIGIPITDTRLKIVDIDTGKELPQGTSGEICAKGPQVMKGYYNRVEDTKLTIDEDGWLHTGDIGYMDEDGFFFIQSRKKDMIIVSAYKVFPPELESYIRKEFDQIEEVAIIGIPDEYQGESVKMIAVLKEGAVLTDKQFINQLKGKIAAYKIPKIIEFRSDPLPKTGIGKIDRKLLQK